MSKLQAIITLASVFLIAALVADVPVMDAIARSVCISTVAVYSLVFMLDGKL